MPNHPRIQDRCVGLTQYFPRPVYRVGRSLAPRRIDLSEVAFECSREALGHDVVEEGARLEAAGACEVMQFMNESGTELPLNRRKQVAIGVDRPRDVAGKTGGNEAEYEDRIPPYCVSETSRRRRNSARLGT